jgi:hypothetical protein
MMGRKKLSEIRSELRDLLARSTAEPGQWFDRQLRRLRKQGASDRREIETLLLLRDALAEAAHTGGKGVPDHRG